MVAQIEIPLKYICKILAIVRNLLAYYDFWYMISSENLTPDSYKF